MSDDNKKAKGPGLLGVPPAPAADTQTEDEQAPRKADVRYIGPAYRRGILLPTGRLVRPMNMKGAERKALIAEYPPAADWWV